ncbi:hypothetical protein AADG42_09335 [Ammonicoccus fulvus]|uniref:DUF222 domain-containing protein n=1 Tax=Ammonicoccus fulvus TaxID=3138240 RepID=A0ABZ3FRP6_9ACTN
MTPFRSDPRTDKAEGLGAWGVLSASDRIEREILDALDAAEEVHRIVAVQDPWGLLLLTARRLVLARDEAGLAIRSFPLTSQLTRQGGGRRRVTARIDNGQGMFLGVRIKIQDFDALEESLGSTRSSPHQEPGPASEAGATASWPVYPPLAEEAGVAAPEPRFPLYGQSAELPPNLPNTASTGVDPSVLALAERIATRRRDCTHLQALTEVPEASKDDYPPEALKARRKARHQVDMALLFLKDAEKESRSMSARWSSISLAESSLDSARSWLGVPPLPSPDR